MKITIQSFCQAFSTELEPFADDLSRALAKLPSPEDLEAIGTPRRGLLEVQQRLTTLREKVSRQRTFLLIFGPLKSGKSTLMNALSGAYVSEVSSLPAYPALVYVKHGEQRHFEASDYEGNRREFADNLALAEAVEADHARLADAIVAAEDQGEAFEPRKHDPKAIRRMDIEVPAPHLAESGSVLVDTPGLYSHMKFGYDQMTRDFRDTAACAIFVVKTDNLFFEKVFEEFEELLSCFSRVFLVSNIDSSKQDLRPDGALEPSLESREPERIIDAFRSLSMSATLRGAIDEDRLKIYPIDLLRAASRTLRGPADDAGTGDGGAIRGDGFDEFVADLTAYLNSSAYLQDFMVDSVRVAQDVTAEAGVLVSGDTAAALEYGQRQGQAALERERAQLKALETLEVQDWDSAFDALRAGRDRLLTELTGEPAAELEKNCQEELTAWMESDESWNALLEQRLNARLAEEAGRQTAQLREQLQAQLSGPRAGLEFSDAQVAAFREAGVPVEEALAGVPRNPELQTNTPPPRLLVDAETIPVARGLADYLLLRGRTRVRMDIFGDQGDSSIDAAVKARRLGGEGLEKLRALVHDTAVREVPELQQRSAAELLETHIERCNEALQSSVVAMRSRVQERIAAQEATQQLRQQAQSVFKELQNSTLRFDNELSELKARFDL